MKEYKRLTETLNCYINGKPCKPYGHCLADCNKQMSFVNPERKAGGCGECQHFQKVLTCLAELEDKIENNRCLILPFLVGQDVFIIEDNEIVMGVVNGIWWQGDFLIEVKYNKGKYGWSYTQKL